MTTLRFFGSGRGAPIVLGGASPGSTSAQSLGSCRSRKPRRPCPVAGLPCRSQVEPAAPSRPTNAADAANAPTDLHDGAAAGEAAARVSPGSPAPPSPHPPTLDAQIPTHRAYDYAAADDRASAEVSRSAATTGATEGFIPRPRPLSCQVCGGVGSCAVGPCLKVVQSAVFVGCERLGTFWRLAVSRISPIGAACSASCCRCGSV